MRSLQNLNKTPRLVFKPSTEYLPGEELIVPLGRGSSFEGSADGGESAGYRRDRVGINTKPHANKQTTYYNTIVTNQRSKHAILCIQRK